jgi:hypothetical protein
MSVSDLTVRSARLDAQTHLVALAGELDLYSADAFRSARGIGERGAREAVGLA